MSTPTKIAYQSIDLTAPARILLGRAKVDSVEAVDGRTITRVIDPPHDFFVVEGHMATPNYRINPLNVVGGVVKDEPAEVAAARRGPKSKGE